MLPNQFPPLTLKPRVRMKEENSTTTSTSEQFSTEMLSIQMLSSSKEVKPKKLLKGKKLPLIRATRFLALALLCPPPLWSGLPCTNLRSKFLASDLQANLSEVRLTSKFLTTVFQGGKKHNRVVAKK